MIRQQEAAEKDQAAAAKEQEAAEKEMAKQQEAMEKQQSQQEEMRDNADRAIRQIIRDMIENGLIESRDAVHSFSLDNNGLILNGVRQSADTYQALRVKYIKSANEHYHYSHNGTGTTTDVKQERN